MIVCDRTSKECMMHQCQNCPGEEPLKVFLTEKLLSNEEDEHDQVICFKQWTTADRSELITRTETVQDFVDILCSQLSKSTLHSYIAKSQANFLKDLKQNLPSNEVILLGDFAEIYSIVVQDEVQGMHWNNAQCSLHPIVIYYKNDGVTKSHSLCFVSNDLKHDVDFVYVVIKETVEFVKSFLVDDLSHIHYFSDGCAAQYKKFLNVCHHKTDFDVNCSWSFFATSHGKSPCDGVGGTLKRLSARASLQRTTSNQIVSPEDFFNFCNYEIKMLTSNYITKDEIDSTREKMKERFEMARTVPGTISYHHFVPFNQFKIATKRLSEDTQYALEFEFIHQSTESALEVAESQFVSCLYENSLWIGVACEIDLENEDVMVKFLHPRFPSPSRNDMCLVPNIHIICKISAPTTATGRQYTISVEHIEKVNSNFSTKK